MEYQKITNLLDTKSDNVPRFITKKWIEVHDQAGSADDRYKPSKKIRFKTSMLRSDLCDYSDAYIVVKGTITVTGNKNIDRKNRTLTLKNNAPLISCISEIKNVLIDNAEDLDIVMHMYNLIEYSENYNKTTGSLCNYFRDEPNNHPDDIHNADPITNSKSFEYKTSITGSTYNVNERITSAEGNEIDNSVYDANKVGRKEVEIAVPLKYLNNIWRKLEMPLINCEINLILIWSEKYVLTDMITRAARRINLPAINAPANATFKTTDTKLYVPVVSLSTERDKKFLERLKTGFKGTIKWNKYRSEMAKQTKSNNLNYLIDSRFDKVNRLFVLTFKNEEDRTSF